MFISSSSLKYLNVSANALETIPPSSQTEESLSTLQELYLTGNNLNENCAALLVGHQNLRVLHVAYNQLLSFPARYQRLCKVSGGRYSKNIIPPHLKTFSRYTTGIMSSSRAAL